jgi:hypothetical protein
MKNILLITLLSVFLTADAQIPTSGLMAYFPFSGNARDTSSNKTHGIVNNATLTSDRYGNPNAAYEFSGSSSSYIEFPSTYVQTNTYTYSIWAKINQTPPMGKMAFALNIGSKSGDQSLNIANNYGGVFNGWLGGGYNTSAPHFSLNENSALSTTPWTHVVCARDSNHIRLYINGVLVDSIGNNSVKMPYYGSTTVKAIIGKRNDSTEPFNGKIDDVLIYNRALTEQEIKNIYQDNSTSIGSKIAANKIDLNVFPNPTQNQFTLSLRNYKGDISSLKLKLTNTIGQEINSIQTEIIDYGFNIQHNLSKGLYLISIINSNNQILTTSKLQVD